MSAQLIASFTIKFGRYKTQGQTSVSRGRKGIAFTASKEPERRNRKTKQTKYILQGQQRQQPEAKVCSSSVAQT